MKIAVLGGGNIGTLMAAEFSSKGHDVWVVTHDASSWSKEIEVFAGDEMQLIPATPIQPTSSIEDAVVGAEYIWITYPIHVMGATADALVSHVKPGQKIGVVPGACAELFYGKLLQKGCILFGLQRVHSVARIKERGRSVYALGSRREELFLASIPSDAAATIATEVQALFDIPTTALPNYLSLTLVPSNPILHTTRIRSMFRFWSESVAFPSNILFYESWDDSSSELLFACDEELQYVCDALPFDLSSVKSLKDHYESQTPRALTRKIASIPAFKGLLSPMKEISQGAWVPDFSSRYFESDFRYGLRCIQQIARLAQVDTPHIDEVLAWYYEVSGERELDLLPFTSLEALKDYYA